ncbi:MAG: hypothetical protein ABW128_16265 [Rhizorhabdus sp.]|jgi:hypothetical protein
MAKVNEADALALLTGAVDLIARMASLVPTLTKAVQDARAGLSTTDLTELNDKIVLAHADVQSLDAMLQALKNA